jgi:hypothetical protein
MFFAQKIGGEKMVDWNQLKPNWRDAFDVGVGVLVDRFVIKRVQEYVSDSMKSAVRSTIAEVYSQQRVERDELYKKIDSLTYEVTEMKKKVGTSA